VGKKKIIKKYELLAPELVSLIEETYPDGFEDKLITFQSPKGELEIALPLETDDAIYMVKMPKSNLTTSDDDDDDDSSISGSDDLSGLESLDAAEDIPDED